jgi:hypothetical protein
MLSSNPKWQIRRVSAELRRLVAMKRHLAAFCGAARARSRRIASARSFFSAVTLLFSALPFSPAAQQHAARPPQDPPRQEKPERVEAAPGPQHAAVHLPAAAHKRGERAGFYTDPDTGNPVYRLSDSRLCPGGARHFYSYTNQFSPAGNIVFACDVSAGRGSQFVYPVYSPDFELLFADSGSAAGAGGGLQDVQWSQAREVLYARRGREILELDPFRRTSRVAADFGKAIGSVTRFDGTEIDVRAIRDLSVGPGDRLLVHLQCRRGDKGCPRDYAVIGIGVYDPAKGRFTAIAVPHSAEAGNFDEAHLSQNPAGRVVLLYSRKPAWSAPLDFSEFVKLDDNHGHTGYVAGSDGRSYRVSVVNDTLLRPDGTARGVGQVGCRDENGRQLVPWRREYGLYDDETGRRVLTWGCDIGLEHDLVPEHFARSPGARDVFASSGMVILRLLIRGSSGARDVGQETVAFTRSHHSQCGYWAYPRAAMDHTGNRFLFDSTMSHPRFPVNEVDGQRRTGCRLDVFVAQAGYSTKAR